MPMPRRSSVDDYFDRLEEHQRPHLEQLRTLSREVAPEAREELKYNLPTYLADDGTHLWMLQNFKRHCSLRFSTEFFATQRDRVTEARFDSGAGFVKLPYDIDLPVDLLTSLMRARLGDVGAGTG
ncbi:hypothetical protein SGUI_0643 [Serinicoccus hydrothermalis]|uniref:YdhG-like domain-containing protein n=1 Tax=Serinicoccus hydrothermalis TaxID=1758689 RepID=A0A1B1N9D7_9MICO|nr:DUF1801 domain-containing protein [Serinicoccus hydrothermalis]ANS78039.1 hypothetical protein SGUI_0643 [Serinicoccus hydrothermalis]